MAELVEAVLRCCLQSPGCSPRQYAHTLLVCSQFCDIGMSPAILRVLPPSVLLPRIERWSDSNLHFLRSCAAAGNSEALFILGMVGSTPCPLPSSSLYPFRSSLYPSLPLSSLTPSSFSPSPIHPLSSLSPLLSTGVFLLSSSLISLSLCFLSHYSRYNFPFLSSCVTMHLHLC
ncbi:unnamed protein product [Closterium sp. NIES-65]|nr:unnamed protein product [Closterium sp. NIES-65]